MTNKTYTIVTVSNYTDEELSELIDNAIESSLSSCKISKDGTKIILKWSGDTPSVFSSMTTYSHTEIREELAKSAWS